MAASGRHAGKNRKLKSCILNVGMKQREGSAFSQDVPPKLTHIMQPSVNHMVKYL